MELGQKVTVFKGTDDEDYGTVSCIGRDSVSVQFYNENDPLYPWEKTIDARHVSPAEEIEL